MNGKRRTKNEMPEVREPRASRKNRQEVCKLLHQVRSQREGAGVKLRWDIIEIAQRYAAWDKRRPNNRLTPEDAKTKKEFRGQLRDVIDRWDRGQVCPACEVRTYHHKRHICDVCQEKKNETTPVGLMPWTDSAASELQEAW